MSKIHFHHNEVISKLKSRQLLKGFIQSIFEEEGYSLQELSIVFCTDDYLLQMNKEVLKHNYYTDILTFDLSSANQFIEGEIYISIDRVADNAKGLGVSYENELHRVIFHGVLHLCGYKDKSLAAKQTMRKKEDYYLGKYFM